MPRRKTTDQDENEIRYRIFKLGHDPEEVAKEKNLSMTRIRVICGGPVSKNCKTKAIEDIYV